MDAPIDAIMAARRDEQTSGFFTYCGVRLGAATQVDGMLLFWLAVDTDEEIRLNPENLDVRQLETTLADWCREKRQG